MKLKLSKIITCLGAHIRSSELKIQLQSVSLQKLFFLQLCKAKKSFCQNVKNW